MAAASSAGAHCWLCGAQSFHGDRYDEAAECAASRRGFSQANYAEYVRFKCCGCKCSIECLDAISELKATRMPAGAKVHDPCGIQMVLNVRQSWIFSELGAGGDIAQGCLRRPHTCAPRPHRGA